MTLIYFVIFYNLTFLIGRSISILYIRAVNKDTSQKIYICGYDISIFYPIICLFFVGNLSQIFNIFFPLKYIIFIIPVLLLVNFIDFRRYKFSLDFWIVNIIFPLIISVSSFGQGFHYDAGLYHLNHQQWLTESNIVIGLTNIYFPFGWSSIYEYISAFFQIGDNYILLHFVNLTFIVQFFSFLYKSIYGQKDSFLKFTSIFILFYGILDNFGVDGGRNGFIYIQSIGKFDNAFAIVFTIFNLLIINQIITNVYKKNDLVFLTLLALFTFQLKLTGGIAIYAYLFYLFLYKTDKNLKIYDVFKLTPGLNVILTFWLIKNFFNTGCLVFGIEFTCFNFIPWYESGLSTLAVSDTSKFNLAYSFGDNVNFWFSDWSEKSINITTLVNFAISILVLTFIKFLFYKTTKNLDTKVYLAILMYMFLNILIWIMGAPDPRFGSAMFLLLIFLLSINISGEKKIVTLIETKFKFYILTALICIGLMPRIQSYTTAVIDFNSAVNISLPVVEYKEDSGWGVRPISGDQCWVNLECTKFNDDLLQKKLFIFNIFLYD